MSTELLYKKPKSLLNKGTGLLSDYSHSLNPYVGCSFGCSYCYVRQMPVAAFRKEEWGTWVDIKVEAGEILRKEIRKAKSKGKVTIFMSSSTDPYQPIEHKEKVTRSMLEVMLEEQPIGGRLEALRQLANAGVPTQATIAPLLPSSEAFPDKLRPLVNRVCLDDYFMGDGSGGRRTRTLGISALYEKLGLEQWYDSSAYRMVYDRLRRVFSEDEIRISQAGFAP
jgi:DNA repair photolyase